MLEVFYEDQDLIVVKKPAGVESQSIHSFAPDMVSEIRKHINRLSTKSGEPYIGVIHRLDKPVGGIMVYARTKKAAAALSRQIQDHQMKKTYRAVVCGKPVDNVGNFVDYLLKDGKNNMSKIVDKGISQSKRAELTYQVVDSVEMEGEVLTLVEIQLLTGRHHQIRVQFAGRGLPLWGDNRYGAGKKESGQPSIALSSCGLSFIHPSTGKLMTFKMEPEGEIFQKFQQASNPSRSDF